MRKERIIRIELKDAGIRSLADKEPDAPGWFLMLNAGILAVIYLSLILPSIFAAKISPAETMRYE